VAEGAWSGGKASRCTGGRVTGACVAVLG
jgi:hypothetical protein